MGCGNKTLQKKLITVLEAEKFKIKACQLRNNSSEVASRPKQTEVTLEQGTLFIHTGRISTNQRKNSLKVKLGKSMSCWGYILEH